MPEPINLIDIGEESDTSATVEFFDPPMCCPTGLCGPALDQTLLDVNEMILGLQEACISTSRYQMSSQPQKFLNNPAVMKVIQEQQLEALPITVVRGIIIKVSAYPSIQEVRAALNGDTR